MQKSKFENYKEPYTPTSMVNEAHDVVKKKSKERKKCLLYLMHQYLKDEGYYESALALEEETQLSPQYCVCDNIDLATILLEFESYYYTRYQKYPKFCRQQTVVESPTDSLRKPKSAKSVNKMEYGRVRKLQDMSHELMKVQPILGLNNEPAFQEALPTLISSSPEMQELANIITKEIVIANLNVQWHDIVGLDDAKSILRETIVYPIKYPGLFQGLLAPWRAVLLYGPPGTGKTMLAKAVASECKTTFFNISSSSIVSKWRGESEKLIKVLFELAKHYAPSTIFMDEFDAIASKTGSDDHEGSRRLRAELLVNLDGLSNCCTEKNIFLLATTNNPWGLDNSMLRRFEKRILVDIPNSQDREAHLRHLLPSTLPNKQGSQPVTCSIDYQHAAQISEGYTGSDLRAACREAAMNMLRQALNVIENEPKGMKSFKLKPITTESLEVALKKTKPTTLDLVKKYHDWSNQLGST